MYGLGITIESIAELDDTVDLLLGLVLVYLIHFYPACAGQGVEDSVVMLELFEHGFIIQQEMFVLRRVWLIPVDDGRAVRG